MAPRRRDLLVSMLPALQARANYTVALSERAGVPELDPFGIRRARTTGLERAPPVGQASLLTTAAVSSKVCPSLLRATGPPNMQKTAKFHIKDLKDLDFLVIRTFYRH